MELKVGTTLKKIEENKDKVKPLYKSKIELIQSVIVVLYVSEKTVKLAQCIDYNGENWNDVLSWELWEEPNDSTFDSKYKKGGRTSMYRFGETIDVLYADNEAFRKEMLKEYSDNTNWDDIVEMYTEQMPMFTHDGVPHRYEVESESEYSYGIRDLTSDLISYVPKKYLTKLTV